MRLTEIDGFHINPDRVAFLEDASSTLGTGPRTRIRFSGLPDDYVTVDGKVAEVANMLTMLTY